jgi:hypothetical protein
MSLFAHETRHPRFIHRLRVAVNQQDLMASRGQRLEKKHPQMWHEISRDPVVGAVK